MISTLNVSDDEYHECYNEIMNKIVILSEVIDENEINKEMFKPGGIGLSILADTFGLKDDSVYVYYVKKLFTVPMLAITKIIITEHNLNDPLLDDIEHIQKLLAYNSKNHNFESSLQLAKNKFLKKYKSVENWHDKLLEIYKQ